MATDSAAAMVPTDIDTSDRSFFDLVWEKVRSKGMKYSLVSVVNVVVGQGLLLLLHGPVGWGATRSNVVAVCVSAVPAYYMNRMWVWGKRGKSDFRTEVLPFWVFVVIGLVMSTVSVTVAARVFTSKLIPNIASIGSFGILWVLRFFILDRMFHTTDLYDVAEEVVEHIDHGEHLIEAVQEVAHEHEAHAHPHADQPGPTEPAG